MPEGDTVWLAAHRLHGALAGQHLTATDFRVPALAAADLAGHRVLAVVPRGKHLLWRLEGGLTLHSHFRMAGAWHLYRPGVRWHGGLAHEVRAVLSTRPWIAVGYRLPVLELLDTADEHRVVGHLGADLLDPEADLSAAVRALREQPDRPLGEALLDQRVVAGMGTIYRTESLYLAGLSPWATPGVLSDGQLLGVLRLGRHLLEANKARGEQVTTGDRRRGRQTWVYGRGGRPCRRCGTTLRQGATGQPPRDRPITWCPGCQP